MPEFRPEDQPNLEELIPEIVLAIPEGRVLSYGQVAAIAGSRAARAVGKFMAHSDGSLPWWRVVRADGTIPEPLAPIALEHYRAEGTPLRWGTEHYRVAREAFAPEEF